MSGSPELDGKVAGEKDGEESRTAPSTSPGDVLSESAIDSMPNDFRSALDEFRDNWQRELKGQGGNAINPSNEDEDEELEDLLCPLPNILNSSEAEQHVLAESFFRKAVELEQRGKVYDALPLYRKALQIVPDIESKFYEDQKIKIPSNEGSNGIGVKNINNHTPLPTPESEELIEDLYEKFQLDLARDYGGKLLLGSRVEGVISTELHISDLPPELLLFILRWVVSTQLDMRSLEQCAAVCKGFYICARDEDIWRLACIKVWGANVGTLANPNEPSTNEIETDHPEPLHSVYTSWRQMFIERERVLFHGCYISKTTYLRMGENSFQDQYYRPVQLVEYYRYVRFMPDGTVYMMTTADEPAQGVAKLKHLQQLRPDILRGHFRLYENTVTVFLQKQQHQHRVGVSGGNHQYIRHRRGSSAYIEQELNSTKYCIEFRIMSTPKRKFSQLVWVHYSIILTRNKVETTSEFDLTASKYPPLWFSPVRSYHLDADIPLN